MYMNVFSLWFTLNKREPHQFNSFANKLLNQKPQPKVDMWLETLTLMSNTNQLWCLTVHFQDMSTISHEVFFPSSQCHVNYTCFS